MSEKLKFMCLHGFGTNKQFMKMQARNLEAELSKLAQFIYIDAPYIVPANLVFDRVVFKHLKKQSRTWFGSKIHKERTELMENLEAIRVAIQTASDHYDGVIGFSQGSMAFQTVLFYHKLGVINWKSFSKLKLFMNFSSVSARIQLKYLNYQRFDIPSMHVLSQEDGFFETMMVTPTRFKQPQLIFHTQGHRFPDLGLKQKRAIIHFINKHGLTQKYPSSQYILSKSKL